VPSWPAVSAAARPDDSGDRASTAALADFDALYDLLAKNNPSAAANTLRQLDAAIHLLIERPRMGRIYSHARIRLRVLIHRDYLVFYRERSGAIEIVRALHGKQNIPDILDEL
jgi:toxin ParE1/3/4